jgi:hypothetical protein
MNRLYDLQPKYDSFSQHQHTDFATKSKGKKHQMMGQINQPRYATHNMAHAHTPAAHSRGQGNTNHGYSSRIHNH